MKRKTKTLCLVSILIFTIFFSGTQMLESAHKVPLKIIQSPVTAVEDDIYEENDDAASAYPITSGFSARLELQDEDWFVIDLNIAEQLSLIIEYDTLSYNVQLTVYDADENDIDAIANGNLTTFAESTGIHYIGIHEWDDLNCSYTLNVTVTSSPSDDIYEENDIADDAYVITSPFSADLVLLDEDWFVITSPIDQLLEVELDYSRTGDWINLEIYIKLGMGGYTRVSYETYSTYCAYTAINADDLYIRVFVDEGFYTDYSLNITLTPFPPDDPYEDDDTMSYGTLITANFSDTLSLVDDDNFNITVGVPTLLNITLDYVTSHENIYWHLRHPEDVVVEDGFDLEFIYVCSEAGSYLYETSLIGYAVIESYTITITLTPLPPDDDLENNDNAAQAIDATGGFADTLTLLDEDWFNITLQADDVVNVSVDCAYSNLEVVLDLYDVLGDWVEGDSLTANTTDAIWTMATTGTFSLCIYTYSLYYASYDLSIVVIPAPPDDIHENNDVLADGVTIADGFSESLTLNDDDYFKISVTTSVLLNISVEYEYQGHYIQLEIYNNFGSPTGTTSDGMVLYKPTNDGVYSIRVFDIEGTYSSYNLTVTLETAPTDDGYEPNDYSYDKYTIESIPFTSDLVLLDSDYFQFSLAADQQLNITLEYTYPSYWLICDLYNPSSNLIATLNNGLNSFNLTTAGTYYLHIHTANLIVVPLYTLSLSVAVLSAEDDEFEENNLIQTSAPIPLNFDADLMLLDEDWFSFTISQPTYLTISLTFTGIYDTYMRIYDDASQQVEEHFGEGDFSLLIINPGIYNLSLSLPSTPASYHLALNAVLLAEDDEFEENDDADQAATVSDGFISTLCVYDLDYFNITIAADQQVNLTFNYVPAVGSVTIFFRINETTVDSLTSNGTLLVNITTAGTYTFWVAPVSGYSESVSLAIGVNDIPINPDPTDPDPTDPNPTDPDPTDPDPTLNGYPVFFTILAIVSTFWVILRKHRISNVASHY